MKKQVAVQIQIQDLTLKVQELTNRLDAISSQLPKPNPKRRLSKFQWLTLSLLALLAAAMVWQQHQIRVQDRDMTQTCNWLRKHVVPLLPPPNNQN